MVLPEVLLEVLPEHHSIAGSLTRVALDNDRCPCPRHIVATLDMISKILAQLERSPDIKALARGTDLLCRSERRYRRKASPRTPASRG